MVCDPSMDFVDSFFFLSSPVDPFLLTFLA